MTPVHRNELILENIVRDEWNLHNISPELSLISSLKMYQQIPMIFPKAVRKSAMLRKTKSFRPLVLKSGNIQYVNPITIDPNIEAMDMHPVAQK